MNERKSDVFMAVAEQIAQLGTCDRARVGAVIIRNGRCISWGYNGAPPGLPHCADNYHGYALDTEFINPENPPAFLKTRLQEHGCINATHAEANALAFAARQGISTDASTLFVTVAPCATCSRLIVAAGIVAVVYGKEYRDRSGIDLLKRAGILAALH